MKTNLCSIIRDKDCRIITAIIVKFKRYLRENQNVNRFFAYYQRLRFYEKFQQIAELSRRKFVRYFVKRFFNVNDERIINFTLNFENNIKLICRIN